MDRRDFLKNGALAGATATALTVATTEAKADPHKGEKFKLNYAPHPGSFKAHGGKDVIDQIKFAADQGFTAWEDNGVGGRSPADQEKIGKTLEQLGMTMGVFVAYADFTAPTFAVKDDAKWKEILTEIKKAPEIAERVNAKWFTVVPGSVDQQSPFMDQPNRYAGPRLAEGYQTANVIELLRRCSAILEPHNLTMVLEPLNWHANHGGTFLRYSDQAFAICRAVNSPSCKILFDIYHQQITEGNLIPNIDLSWDEIAYFQAGDNPGRKEPGTGEINYRNVFKHIHDRAEKEGRNFVIGMEHGNSVRGKEGEQKLIQAYRDADNF